MLLAFARKSFSRKSLPQYSDLARSCICLFSYHCSLFLLVNLNQFHFVFYNSGSTRSIFTSLIHQLSLTACNSGNRIFLDIVRNKFVRLFHFHPPATLVPLYISFSLDKIDTVFCIDNKWPHRREIGLEFRLQGISTFVIQECTSLNMKLSPRGLHHSNLCTAYYKLDKLSLRGHMFCCVLDKADMKSWNFGRQKHSHKLLSSRYKAYSEISAQQSRLD